MTALPDNHCSGPCKTKEEDGDQGTPRPEIWTKIVVSKFKVQLEKEVAVQDTDG